MFPCFLWCSAAFSELQSSSVTEAVFKGDRFLQCADLPAKSTGGSVSAKLNKPSNDIAANAATSVILGEELLRQ
jgi:hypothetical protein